MIKSQIKQHRIVSLLPSATEILHFIRQDHLLIGRSHECDYPKSVSQLPVVTSPRLHFSSSKQINDEVTNIFTSCKVDTNASLYDINIDMILALKPTLIITQDICSVCSVNLSQIEKSIQTISISERPTILSLNPLELQDILDNIIEIGKSSLISDDSH